MTASKGMTPAQADRLCNSTARFVLVNYLHKETYCGFVVDRDRRLIYIDTTTEHGLVVVHRDEIDEWHQL